MDNNFIFRGGKHAGKTYGLVYKIDPGYILWCEENAPGMLKGKNKPKTVVPAAPRREPLEDSEIVKGAIQPNLNFLDEGPNGKQK